MRWRWRRACATSSRTSRAATACAASSSPWVIFAFPAALLVIGHLGLTTKRFLMTEAGKLKSDEESAETNRMMGLALQGQGQLDMALDRVRHAHAADQQRGQADQGEILREPLDIALERRRRRVRGSRSSVTCRRGSPTSTCLAFNSAKSFAYPSRNSGANSESGKRLT